MIIRSLLDSDFYKLTMMQAAYLNFPNLPVKYEFMCRTPDVDFSRCYTTILDETDHLCNLQFTQAELDYLADQGLFRRGFLEALKTFKLSRESVTIRLVDGQLSISVHGTWWQTVMFEVPILAIVNECYYRQQLPVGTQTRRDAFKTGDVRLARKIDEINGAPENFRLMEFGTRRRFSRDWQDDVIAGLLTCLVPWAGHTTRQCPVMGTSNVKLAMDHGIQPMGTMAHEWLQAFQALGPLREFQQRALETWMLTYRGNLGIALTDCITYDRFERNFDLLLAKAYDGVRHDSGDPEVWCGRVISHYRYLGIDPKTKTAIFSDGLTIPKAISLARQFGEQINCVFGIGTDLTNDLGPKPLSIVMKMVACNGQPVAKISDEPGKTTCSSPTYLAHLKDTFNLS